MAQLLEVKTGGITLSMELKCLSADTDVKAHS
jgi:hypothetical protein